MKLEQDLDVRGTNLSEAELDELHLLALAADAQLRHPELRGVYGQLETLLEWSRESLARFDRADRALQRA